MRFKLPARFQVPRDIDAELRFHFEARIEELIARGASREDALKQALADFGDVNDVRSDLQAIDDRLARRREGRLLDTLRQDVVYASRALRRTPAVAFTIILTLALGVGVNTAMFSLLDVIFLRPPAGVVNPDGLRRVWAQRTFRSGTQFWPGYDYSSYVAIEQSLAGRGDLAVYRFPQKMTLGRGENPPTVNVAPASASFLRILGVRPALGRFYDVDEDRLGAGAPVLVLSDRLWKRSFGGDLNVVGKVAFIAQQPFTIIGVAPPRFSGVELDANDAWIPLSSSPDLTNPEANARTPWYRNPNVNGFQVLVRPRPDASDAELEQRLTVALRQPGIGWRQDTTVVARFGSIVRARGPGKLDTAVQVAERAGAVAIIVLVIAFANVVNLLLARAFQRRREIAVRIALGISGLRLVRLLVTESVLLALVAAGAAVAAASWGGTLLRKLLMPEVNWAENPLHWRVLLLGVVAAVVAGAAAGLVPALQSRATDLTNALKAGTRGSGAQRSRLRPFLVATQAALAVVLIVGAALFLRSLSNVRGLDIGYSVDRLAFVAVKDGSDKARAAEISDRLLQMEERLAAVPGIERVAYTSMQPKWGISFTDYFPDGHATDKGVSGFYTAVSPGFFAASGTRILRGRTFASGAAGRTEQAVLINKTAADSLWPNQDPLGRCIRFKQADAACYRVIGVTQTAILIDIKETPEMHVYVPLANMPFKGWGVSAVVLRVKPERLTAATNQVRSLMRDEFPGAKVTATTMAAAMEPEYRPWQLGATLFTLFGVLAAVVAAIGVYSMVSYAVTQRTHEFGVRMALGARGETIVTQVVGEGVKTVAIGVVAGIALALLTGRVIASLLYGISPRDPGVMMLAGGALLVVAALASFAPAWRAGRSDPVSALRMD